MQLDSLLCRLLTISLVIVQCEMTVHWLSADEKKDQLGPSNQKFQLKVAKSDWLSVKAFWEPIKESMYRLHNDWDELRNLRPAKETVDYAGFDFQAFLPAHPVAEGEIWDLSREGLLKFLRQFHKRATLDLHLNNGDSLGGGFACLKACNEQWADIMFRCHGEFVLEGGFFTPGRFIGRLILGRKSGHVVYFRLHLPPSQVNYDLGKRFTHWVKLGDKEVEQENHATDAGFLPRLELIGGNESVLAIVEKIPGQTIEQVTQALAHRFYRSSEIQWIDFGQALIEARRRGKPLHVVALEGTFDDESC